MLEGLDPATIIAVFALLGGIVAVVEWRLEPVKEAQTALKTEIENLKNGQVRLEKGQVRLENKIDLILKEKA